MSLRLHHPGPFVCREMVGLLWPVDLGWSDWNLPFWRKQKRNVEINFGTGQENLICFRINTDCKLTQEPQEYADIWLILENPIRSDTQHYEIGLKDQALRILNLTDRTSLTCSFFNVHF